MADIPPRPEEALGGARIRERILQIMGNAHSGSAADMERRMAQLEEFLVGQFMSGNVPDFMRPENWREISVETQVGGRTIQARVRVCPDYVAIGSNTDYVRIPLSALAAQRIADRFGFSLPTQRLVDTIDATARQITVRDSDGREHHGMLPFLAAPQVAERVTDPATGQPVRKKWNLQKYGHYEGRWMISGEFLIMHDRMNTEALQRAGNHPFRSGTKKDVIYDPLALQESHEGGLPVVIYRKGIQGLSNWHNEKYWDYSHGIRFLSSSVQITVRERDGSERQETLSMRDVLMHREYYRLFSAAQMDISKMYRSTQRQARERSTQSTPRRTEQVPASNVQFGDIQIHRERRVQTH
jgi:hypothetical protein